MFEVSDELRDEGKQLMARTISDYAEATIEALTTNLKGNGPSAYLTNRKLAKLVLEETIRLTIKHGLKFGISSSVLTISILENDIDLTARYQAECGD